MSATLAGVATAAIFAIGAVRTPRPALYVAAVAVVLLVWDLPRPGSGATEIHMLDVGQGDAVALRTQRGRWIIVDVGRGWTGGDAAQTTVLPHLRRYGGRVAALILSHPHMDHIGGATTLLEATRPAALYDAGFVAPGGGYRRALETAQRLGIPWRRPTPGDSLVVDEVVLTFLAPDSAWTSTLHDANDASVVVMARIGARRMLFTGDAELAEETWLLANTPHALRADVLKVGHHGSRTSTSPAFLAAVQPAAALISVGAGNDYRHPSPGTLDALSTAGAHILRTDHVGPIVVRTDGRSLSIHADGRTWHAPP
ncbi:MAG: MBL fold metallo-hydrolase [Gemmatimonadaceae bacterium]|nr:MBL fold metallo-hydrolase [Gemmatimonadaceae bacterium]